MSFPDAASFLRFYAPNTGTPMTEIARISVKQNMIMDCLPNFLMYKLREASPMMEPTTDTNAHHIA